jgi:hypothetical protein
MHDSPPTGKLYQAFSPFPKTSNTLSFNFLFTTPFFLMTLFYYDFYVFAQLLISTCNSNVCEIIYTPWLYYFWNKFGKF